MNDTPEQHEGFIPINEIIEDLKELQEKLKACSDRGHQGWKITRCLGILDKIHECAASADEQKRDVKRRLVDNLEEICLGWQQASIMRFVYAHSKSDVVKKDRQIFISGSIPTATQMAASNTNETDTLFERFTECLLKKAQCTDIRREPGEEKRVDLVFTHGGHKFAAECKRPKNRKRIRELMSTARKQLATYSKESERIPLICLDCTLPIIKEIKEVVTQLRPVFECTEGLVWKAFDKIFEEDIQKDVSNSHYNSLGMALVPYVSRNFIPTLSSQLLAARNYADTPESAIKNLYDSIMKTKGLIEFR